MPAGGQRNGDTGSTETSRSLLALLKANDSDGWQRLVQLYSPLIYFWCRGMNLPEQDMPDVFQEVFHAVSRNIEGFRRDRPGDTFRGWLRTVTKNKVRDHYRRQQKEPQPIGGTDAQIQLSQQSAAGMHDANDDAAEEAGEDQAYWELLQRALAAVRPHFQEQTWQAFGRVVLEGKTPCEVADELSMRPGTVRVAKSRVLQRLRQELGDLFG